MKKNQTVQGTFSKLFGKKHANPNATSLYATNPPWIFTQEAPEEGPRGFDGIYYGENQFNTVSESGTATLKARPRVRPLLTFLPLNVQENHGLAVPTPCVPEDFANKGVTGSSMLVNGNLRLYSSVGDLRPGHYGQDPLIPPPPPGPAPGPPPDMSQPQGESPPPPPPPFAPPPPPPLLLEPPPPPNIAPPPPPPLGALSPPPALPSPSTPTPPDFIPPAPPLVTLAPPPPPLPVPAPPAPLSLHLFPPGGVTKWKSEVALNSRQPETPRTSPPKSPAEPKGSPLGPKPEPHLTFPRSFKVPPPTPVRTSSIPIPETPGAPPEDGLMKKGHSRLPLPPSFHIRPASQVYPDSAPESESPGGLRTAAPASPRLGPSLSSTQEQAETPPPAPPLPPHAPPLPPPPPPQPPPAPPLPPNEKPTPPPTGFTKKPKNSFPAPQSKPSPPSPEDTGSSEPMDLWDPRQMDKLRSELAAYLCGSRREDRLVSQKAGPNTASKEKEGKKCPSPPEKEGLPSLPEKETPPAVPEKSLCHLPEREATTSLTLPPVDYIPQEASTTSVRQIRNELEARISSSADKENKPSIRFLPPKPRLEGGRFFESKAENGKFSKPWTKNLTPLSTAPLPTSAFQTKATPGPATPPKATSGPALPPKATPAPALPSSSTALPTASSQRTTEKNVGPSGQWEKTEPQVLAASSQPEAEGRPSEASKPSPPRALSSPALPPKTGAPGPGREEMTCIYQPHRSLNNPSREVAVVTPTVARETAGTGGPVEVKEPQELPAKPPAAAPPAEELLRHPVTGEVVERGSPMALLLAARQRAQKGRLGSAGLGRSSLPGSLRGHSGHGSQPEAGSDSIFYNHGRPNSFTVVPKLPKEEVQDPALGLSAQPSTPAQWKPQPPGDPEGPESSRARNGTKAEPQVPGAWERPARCSLARGRAPPRSFSSPPSPSYKREDEDEDDKEFSFELIPPPPEFSSDPEPPAPAPAPAAHYRGRRCSPPRNSPSDLGLPPVGSRAPPRGSSRLPAAASALYGRAGAPERRSGGGGSLIKKRLYVGEHPRGPGLPRGGPGRSLSTPSCFGPPPGGPDMRRVNSAGRAAPGGLHTRRTSLEGAARGDTKVKAAAGDYGFAPAAARSPHYGNTVNTFTVRPGTRHPISYAYSGAHRKATS